MNLRKLLNDRLIKLEQRFPEKPTIDESLIDVLEEDGYSIKSRVDVVGKLDYSSQGAFDRSVVELLTTEELRQLAAQYPLEQ